MICVIFNSILFNHNFTILLLAEKEIRTFGFDEVIELSKVKN